MEEQELLLLGLLKFQSQHGYQINEFIEKNLSRVTPMKKATAYATLERLAKSGFINVHNEQEGNRPVRKVYSITPEGEEQFMKLLRHNLSSAEPLTFAGDVGLMFMDHLEQPELIACLEKRLAQIEEQLLVYSQPLKHVGLGVNLALEHQAIVLGAEREWLHGVLDRLRRLKPGEPLETILI